MSGRHLSFPNWILCINLKQEQLEEQRTSTDSTGPMGSVGLHSSSLGENTLSALFGLLKVVLIVQRLVKGQEMFKEARIKSWN